MLANISIRQPTIINPLFAASKRLLSRNRPGPPTALKNPEVRNNFRRVTKGRAVIKLRDKRPCVIEQRQRNAQLEQKAEQTGLEWRIMGSIIYHRYPEITKDEEPWQTEYHNLEDLVNERRKKWIADKLKGTTAAVFLPESEEAEIEDILKTMPFTPADRITEADKTNDRRSLDRRLQDSLFLIVKRNRSDHSWQFPQGKWLQGEQLRQTSQRILERAIGKPEKEPYFFGNSPIGHYAYEYPKSVQDKRQNFGAKLFFHRSIVLDKSIKLETRLYTDYAWIARDEVKEYFDEDTAKYLQALLPF